MNTTTFNTTFAEDVRKGLNAEHKYLSSKYFYDATGDKLFQKIMNLPEYYLTRSEFAILEKYKESIIKPLVDRSRKFNLVELGAGDGLKTRILIKYLYSKQVSFNYYPIDISGSVLRELQDSLQIEFPELPVYGVENTYIKALKEKRWDHDYPTLMIFLGSNIGNFLEREARDLMVSLADALDHQEMLLVGFDLKKDPDLILQAYNDSQGVTRDFNLNVLSRINRELGGDFDLQKFKHWPVYDPVSGECRSYLISNENQTVTIAALDQEFIFQKAEPIFTEVSKKSSLKEIKKYAEENGFEVLGNYLDDKAYFTDTLWRKK
jgi:dimethylhistidine N-methyltransferase